MGAVVLLGVRAGGLVHFGVAGGPPLAADVAKLVPALAGHVVAALRFLYDHLAAATGGILRSITSSSYCRGGLPFCEGLGTLGSFSWGTVLPLAGLLRPP